MRKVFLYPIGEEASMSFYIRNSMNCLSGDFEFINRRSPSDLGIFNLIKYIFKVDYLFLNWVEDLPDKRGGVIQSVFFILSVYLSKLLRVKILWVLHNKESHYSTNRLLKAFLFKFLIRKSNYILTHSREGLNYLDQYPAARKRSTMYCPHPLEKKFIQQRKDPSIDFLIWGSIIPYKGIDKFLELLYEFKLENRYRIVIAGKVQSSGYEELISGYCNESIRLDNRFIPENELIRYLENTKTVLFTYVGNSVLSSGALMESLSFGVNILAPEVGAFRDTKDEGIIDTYKDYNELGQILQKGFVQPGNRRDSIESFIKANNWDQFSRKISDWLDLQGPITV